MVFAALAGVALMALSPHAAGPRYGARPARPLRAAGATMAAEMVWSEEPENVWEYDGYTVHYNAAGDPADPVMLLIHGFGASGFHWRRNVNQLAAAGHRVYAIDLIGFGLSSKPVIEYDSSLWREQLTR